MQALLLMRGVGRPCGEPASVDAYRSSFRLVTLLYGFWRTLAGNVAVGAGPLVFFRSQSPLRGMLHGVACATVITVGVGATIDCFGRSITSLHPAPFERKAHAEWNWAGDVAGGVLGGVTHSLPDAWMYLDVQPLWPIIPDNRLLSAVGGGTVQFACLAAGFLGAIWLVGRLYLAGTTG